MVLSNGLEPVNHKIIVHPAIFLSADYYTFGKKFFQNILPLKYDIRGGVSLFIRGNAEHDCASLSFSSSCVHAHTFLAFGIHPAVVWGMKAHGSPIGISYLQQDIAVLLVQFDDIFLKV